MDATGVKGYLVYPFLTHAQKALVRTRTGLESQGLQKDLQPLLRQLSALTVPLLIVSLSSISFSPNAVFRFGGL